MQLIFFYKQTHSPPTFELDSKRQLSDWDEAGKYIMLRRKADLGIANAAHAAIVTDDDQVAFFPFCNVHAEDMGEIQIMFTDRWVSQSELGKATVQAIRYMAHS